jgi:hypothetical protein
MTAEILERAFIGDNPEMRELLKNKNVKVYDDKYKDSLSSVADTKPPTLHQLKNMFRVVNVKSKVDTELWKRVLSIPDSVLDEEFSRLFPFRTADDKKIRNIRFLDIRKVIEKVDVRRQNIIRKAIVSNDDLDYIFICNFCLYICVVDHTILDFWEDTSLLLAGTWGFTDIVGNLSNYIKTKKEEQYIQMGSPSGTWMFGRLQKSPCTRFRYKRKS